MNTNSSHNRPIPPLQYDLASLPAVVQSEMPSLVQLLVQEFQAQCLRQNSEVSDPAQLRDPQIAIQAAKPLLDFFDSYLDLYRPVQTFPVDFNYGLVLSNNLRCTVSPSVETEAPGSMQDSGAIHVTMGKSNPGQNGVISTDPLYIR